MPLTELHTQNELLERMLRTERLLAFLAGGFGFIATALAANGLLAGLPFAYGIARLLATNLYEIAPADPKMMTASTFALLRARAYAVTAAWSTIARMQPDDAAGTSASMAVSGSA